MLKDQTALLKRLLPELHFSQVRSGGPGGQHVNKVSSKVILTWSLTSSQLCPPELKAILQQRLKLSQAGELRLSCDTFRQSSRNKVACLESFLNQLNRALTVSKPRRPTRATLSSQQRRLQSKKKIGQKKRQRQRPAIDD